MTHQIDKELFNKWCREHSMKDNMTPEEFDEFMKESDNEWIMDDDVYQQYLMMRGKP